jgi:hypothetical protein
VVPAGAGPPAICCWSAADAGGFGLRVPALRPVCLRARLPPLDPFPFRLSFSSTPCLAYFTRSRTSNLCRSKKTTSILINLFQANTTSSFLL